MVVEPGDASEVRILAVAEAASVYSEVSVFLLRLHEMQYIVMRRRWHKTIEAKLPRVKIGTLRKLHHPAWMDLEELSEARHELL